MLAREAAVELVQLWASLVQQRRGGEEQTDEQLRRYDARYVQCELIVPSCCQWMLCAWLLCACLPACLLCACLPASCLQTHPSAQPDRTTAPSQPPVPAAVNEDPGNPMAVRLFGLEPTRSLVSWMHGRPETTPESF